MRLLAAGGAVLNLSCTYVSLNRRLPPCHPTAPGRLRPGGVIRVENRNFAIAVVGVRSELRRHPAPYALRDRSRRALSGPAPSPGVSRDRWASACGVRTDHDQRQRDLHQGCRRSKSCRLRIPPERSRPIRAASCSRTCAAVPIRQLLPRRSSSMACVLFVIDLALPAGAPAPELPIELPAADDRAGLPQYAATIVGGIDRCLRAFALG